MAKRTAVARFWSKVNKDGPIPDYAPHLGPCWLWTAALNKGYAKVGIGSRTRRAHIWSWEQVNGPVPDGLELDHLCRVKRCVNPGHLEAVTHAENMRRAMPVYAGPSNPFAGHCVRGHAWDAANTRVRPKSGRICRTCHREAENARRRNLREI